MSLRALLSFTGAFTIIGCTIGGETIVNEHAAAVSTDAGAASPASTSAAKSAGATCAGGKLVAVDVSKLKTCKAHGHCYPTNKLPATTPGPLFPPCDDASEACVPDEILTAGGKKLKPCTQPDSIKSVAGPGGGCVTLKLLPEVEAKAGQFLQRRECDVDQVCVPCKNPEDNSDSPFCSEIGVYEDACEAGTAAPKGTSAEAGAPAAGMPCCTANGKSNGVCMPASVLPADKKDAMPQDTCAPADVCMPAAMVQGKGTSCNAGLLLGKGVCMDRCFNTMLKIAGVLRAIPQDACGETELCTPCSVLEEQMPPGIAVPGCR